MNVASKNLDHYLRQKSSRICYLNLLPFSASALYCFRIFENNKISFVYLLIKLCYILIALMDLWILTLFFGTDFYYFGVTVVRLLWNHGPKDTNLFPKITLCDFYVREKGNLKTHTVMCVLTINLFTEKIFLIVWTILVANIVLTTANLGKFFSLTTSKGET